MQVAGPLFRIFDDPTQFSTHMFSKVCFPLLWEAHFRKTMFRTSDQAYHLFAPRAASKRAPSVFFVRFCLVVPTQLFNCARNDSSLAIEITSSPCVRLVLPTGRSPCMKRGHAIFHGEFNLGAREIYNTTAPNELQGPFLI